ncbi:RidA family protein [Aspergillus undulatus]|uniref:RidA family protein n=1 Tax=Aspergillus undulatus TaxID=1810928 RepID=UPI003CCD015E
MSPTAPNSTVTTANLPNKKHSLPTSDISIVHFPPGTDTPTLAFIRTSPQDARRPPQTPRVDMPRPFREQARNAFINLADLLAQGGARPQDVTKLTIYLSSTQSGPGKTFQLGDAMEEFFTYQEPDGRLRMHKPPVVIFRDQVLGEGHGKIEVDAEAVVRLALPVPPPSYDSI